MRQKTHTLYGQRQEKRIKCELGFIHTYEPKLFEAS